MADKFEDLGFEETFEDIGFEPELKEKKADKPEVDVVNEEPSQLESLGRGMVQGGTFGFGEEIGAGVLTAADKLRRMIGIETEEEKVAKQLKDQGFSGDIGTPMEDKTMEGQYRDLRDTTRDSDKESQKAHPGTYLTGEIAGGILPSVVTGGAGAAAKGLAKAGTMAAAKKGAVAGAKMGALYAAGKSEGDLTKDELSKVVKDIGVGSVGGALLGGVISGSSAGIKKGIDYIRGSNFYDEASVITKRVINSFKKTLEDKEFIGLKAGEKVQKELEQTAKIFNYSLNRIKNQIAKKRVEKSFSKDGNRLVKMSDRLDDDISGIDKYIKSMKGMEGTEELTALAKVRKVLTDTRDKYREEIADIYTNLQPKDQAQAKLAKKLRDIVHQNRIGVPEKKAITNLYNKIAKMGKDRFKADDAEIEKIRADFNLPDQESTLSFVRDVAKLGIKKPMVDKKSGLVIDMPVKLREVIKKYQPTGVKETSVDGVPRLYFQHGAKEVSEEFAPKISQKPIELGAKELYGVQKQLGKAIPREPSEVKNFVVGLQNKYRNVLEKEALSPENLGNYQKGMDLYRDLYAIRDIMKNKDVFGKLDAQQKDSLLKTIDFLKNFSTTELTGPKQKAEMGLLVDKLNKIAPEFGKKMISKVQDKVSLLELSKASQGSSLQTGGSIRGFLSGGLQSYGVRGARRSAQLYKATKPEKLSEGVRNIFNNLTKASSDQLSGLSKKATDKGYTGLATFLDNISSAASEQKKQALLYSASMKYSKEMGEILKDISGIDV